AASGASCTYLVRNAIVTLPKLSTAVMAVGDRVHWDIDSSPPQLIGASAAAGDILNVGQVVEAAGNGATTVKVALTPDNASVYPDSTAALDTSVANLNAWATALATKLNADAGVTDTNYDTDPQT
ncbi:MAG: capsid cement protein, partial [Rudaea sp.]